MQVNITLRKLKNPKLDVSSVYAANVQHDATLNGDECAPSIAAYLKVTPIQFKTAWKALAGGLKRQAKLGNQSTKVGTGRRHGREQARGREGPRGVQGRRRDARRGEHLRQSVQRLARSSARQLHRQDA